MAKGFKETAAAAQPVYSTIIGAKQDAEDAMDVKDVQNAERTKGGRYPKYGGPMERLNLKIPAELKAYLQAAAYRESSPTRTVSSTEYLCQIIREDMERHASDEGQGL